MNTHSVTPVLIMLTAILVNGCSKKGQDHGHDHEHGHDHGKEEHLHEHKAPHGGTLISLGDHFAHLELVLEEPSGKLTAYVLDKEAEKPIRIKQEELVIKAELGAADKVVKMDLNLKATVQDLTGEKVGDTSQFEGTAEELKGVKAFKGRIEKIDLLGKQFSDIGFAFPAGNEEGGAH